jgi:hypothetical protein
MVRMIRCAAPLSLTALRAALRREVKVDSETIRPPQNAVDQIILADDPATVPHEIDEKVEHLGFERDEFGPAAQFASLGIEHVIAKPENHPCPPGPARASAS